MLLFLAVLAGIGRGGLKRVRAGRGTGIWRRDRVRLSLHLIPFNLFTLFVHLLLPTTTPCRWVGFVR